MPPRSLPQYWPAIREARVRRSMSRNNGGRCSAWSCCAAPAQASGSRQPACSWSMRRARLHARELQQEFSPRRRFALHSIDHRCSCPASSVWSGDLEGARSCRADDFPEVTLRTPACWREPDAERRLGDLGAVPREPVRWIVNRPAGATPFCVFGGTAFMERIVKVANAQRVCRRGGLPTPAGVWFGPR